MNDLQHWTPISSITTPTLLKPKGIPICPCLPTLPQENCSWMEHVFWLNGLVLGTYLIKHVLLVANSTIIYRLMVLLTCLSSGQSYKHFTLVNYDSRAVIWGIFQSGTTQESYFTSVKCFFCFCEICLFGHTWVITLFKWHRKCL